MNKEYQGLIAIDLDGTLFRGDGKISDFSVHVLQKAIEKGYVVILCSGRPYRAMEETVERLNAPFPVVCYNGGLVFNPHDPSFPTVSHQFKVGDVKQLFVELSPYCRYFRAEDGKRLYLNEDEHELDRYFPRLGANVVLGDYRKTIESDCFTFLCSYEVKDKEAIETIGAKCHPYGLRFWRDLLYAELYFPDGDKGAALRYLMDYYKVDRANVYAFGDGSNDKTMLETAGHPFAMANAKPGLVDFGFPVTKKGNSEDGVALTLIEELKL